MAPQVLSHQVFITDPASFTCLTFSLIFRKIFTFITFSIVKMSGILITTSMFIALEKNPKNSRKEENTGGHMGLLIGSMVIEHVWELSLYEQN